MRRYVYEIRNHSLPQTDWENADALVAMLLASLDGEKALSLGDGKTRHTVPVSVAKFLLEGLLRLIGEDDVSLVVLAAKARLEVKEVAQILQENDFNIRHKLRQHDRTDIRLSNGRRQYYDQAGILGLFGSPEAGQD